MTNINSYKLHDGTIISTKDKFALLVNHVGAMEQFFEPCEDILGTIEEQRAFAAKRMRMIAAEALKLAEELEADQIDER